jgi:voltage-gated potassium channel
MKRKRLWHIIKATKVIEELVILSITMFIFAFVLLLVEPHITTFGDAIWYTFSVVTTIGFGDVVVITFVGRMLSVILGLFGIFMVAIITSVIVNYYQSIDSK